MSNADKFADEVRRIQSSTEVAMEQAVDAAQEDWKRWSIDWVDCPNSVYEIFVKFWDGSVLRFDCRNDKIENTAGPHTIR